MTVVGGRRSPAGRGNRRCVCEHGPGVHPSTGPCSLYTLCGCRGWQAADEHTTGHSCQRSDDAEATVWMLSLLGHLSGDNRARIGGWPVWEIAQALRLMGKEWAAQDLEFAAARRARQESEALPIPTQRPPHPLERNTNGSVRRDIRGGRNVPRR